jgi:death-on-curing protein
MPKEPDFLTVDEVLAIHAHHIQRYGGSTGLRDRGLLESALAMPRATAGGQRVHATVWEQAAAYLFHLTKNHPFVDGNKRVGLACAFVFLRLNGKRVRATDDELVQLVEGVASGRVPKSEVAVFLQLHGAPARIR